MAAMPPPTSVRVLFGDPGRPVSRDAIDWVAVRQSYARVILPPALLEGDALPARGRHEPFESPAPESARLAAEAAALLAEPGSGVHAAAVAAALALLEGAAVIVPERSSFSSLIPLSSWSMNLPQRPTDGLLVQHLGIAGRLPRDWNESAAAALTAILSGDPALVRRVTRTRRLAARREGPSRFGRLAKKSAGLRPAVVYLDLLAAEGAAAPGFGEWLRGVAPERATDLLSVAGAIFI
jgi:hypothetical protein